MDNQNTPDDVVVDKLDSSVASGEVTPKVHSTLPGLKNNRSLGGNLIGSVAWASWSLARSIPGPGANYGSRNHLRLLRLEADLVAGSVYDTRSTRESGLNEYNNWVGDWSSGGDNGIVPVQWTDWPFSVEDVTACVIDMRVGARAKCLIGIGQFVRGFWWLLLAANQTDDHFVSVFSLPPVQVSCRQLWRAAIRLTSGIRPVSGTTPPAGRAAHRRGSGRMCYG